MIFMRLNWQIVLEMQEKNKTKCIFIFYNQCLFLGSVPSYNIFRQAHHFVKEIISKKVIKKERRLKRSFANFILDFKRPAIQPPDW